MEKGRNINQKYEVGTCQKLQGEKPNEEYLGSRQILKNCHCQNNFKSSFTMNECLVTFYNLISILKTIVLPALNQSWLKMSNQRQMTNFSTTDIIEAKN